MQFIFGLLIGGLISGLITWLITYLYYKKAYSDQINLFNKLSKDIRDAILQDARDKLTVKELNALIDEKSLDPDMISPLPFKACPKCGSQNLKGGEYTDIKRDDLYYYLKCEDCGWFDWTE